MTPSLRPLRLGEILDRAILLYRHNFLQLIGIVALVQVPVTLIQTTVSVTTFGNAFSRLGDAFSNPATAPGDPFAVFGPSYFVGASLSSAVGILGFILLQGVATAALTVAVAGSYFGDAPTSIGDAYSRIKDKWVQVVGALLLAAALAIALGIWWIIPCFGWLTGGGMLLFLWYVIIPLLVPVIIFEDSSPTTAWRRAWMLARRRFWWVLGFAIILYTFNLLVVAGPAAVVTLGSQLLSGNPFEMTGESFTFQTVAQSLTVLITGLFYLPLQVAAMTVLYFDLRVRTEGLDLALAAESLAGSGSTIADLIAVSPAAGGNEPLLKPTDWRNFVFLTLATLLGFALLYGLILVLAFSLVAALGPV
ncbi:MAG: hypothetical protein ACOC9E_04470 [Chloroflexota bacterium]